MLHSVLLQQREILIHERRRAKCGTMNWVIHLWTVPEITTCIALRGSLRDPQIMPLTVFK